MAIRVRNRLFAPTLFGSVLAVAVMMAFAQLGMWQLERAEEKRAVSAAHAAGERSVIDLAADNAATLQRYQQVRVTGRYDPEHQLLLDNMPSKQGQPGFRVLTPLQLDDGSWILVDRGWLPMGATRAELPTVSVTNDARTVVGRLDELPRPGLRLGEAEEPAVDSLPWPRVLSFPQHHELEKTLKRDLQRPIILLDALQPDGYERAWEARFRFGPDRHIGYAVQWFALAAAVCAAYVIVSFRAEPSS